MKQRIAYIINPISGTSCKQAIAAHVEQAAVNSGDECVVYYTKCAGDATGQARAFADAGFDKVVAVGGDGTVNEVACGLIKTDSVLGIIPFGSGNGLARHLKIPFNYHKANEIILNSNIIEADYGLLNGRPFFCTAGTGFDAQVGKRFAAAGRRGFVTYAQASFLEYLKYRSQTYRITIDGKTFSRRAFLITFANSSQWGYNAYISPKASLKDGLLDIVVVSPFVAVKAPVLGIQMFTKSIYRSSNIEVFRCREITVEREQSGYIHIDGDPMRESQTLKVQTIVGELKIATPHESKKFRLKLPYKF